MNISFIILLFVFFYIGLPEEAISKDQAGVAQEGTQLLGRPAKEWEVENWFNSRPLQLRDLKGKVVLVRFWTAPICPFCSASAPALNEFYEKYHHQGLEVIGFYHHKSSSPLSPKDVRRYAEKFKFQFPIAIDKEWKTLRQWWLDGHQRDWTSITFLIDQTGVTRYIHPGGQYVKGDKEYAGLKTKIEELLNE